MVNENDKILTWSEIKALVGKNPGPFVHEENVSYDYPFEEGYHPTWGRIAEEFPVIEDIGNKNSSTEYISFDENLNLALPSMQNYLENTETLIAKDIFRNLNPEKKGKKYEYINLGNMPSFNILFTDSYGDKTPQIPNNPGGSYTRIPAYFYIVLDVILRPENGMPDKVIYTSRGGYCIEIKENYLEYKSPYISPTNFNSLDIISIPNYDYINNSTKVDLYYKISIESDNKPNLSTFSIQFEQEKTGLNNSFNIYYKYMEELVGIFCNENDQLYCPSKKNLKIENVCSIKIIMFSNDNENFHNVKIQETNIDNPNIVKTYNVNFVERDGNSNIRFKRFSTEYPATYYLINKNEFFCSESIDPNKPKVLASEKYKKISINNSIYEFDGTNNYLGESSINGSSTAQIFLKEKHIMSSLEIDFTGIGNYLGDIGRLYVIPLNSNLSQISEPILLYYGEFPLQEGINMVITKSTDFWKKIYDTKFDFFRIKYLFNENNEQIEGTSDEYSNNVFWSLLSGNDYSSIKLTETPKIYFKIKGNNKAINSSDKIFDIDSISISNLYLYGITLFINIDNVSTPFIIHEENSNEIDLDYSKGASLGFCIHNNTNSLETYNKIKNIKNNIVTLESVGFYTYPGFTNALNNYNISFMFNIFDNNNNNLLKNVYGDKSLTTYDIDHNILNVKIPNNITLDISKANKFYISDLYTIKNYIYTFSLDSNKIAPIPSESWEENYYSHTLTELGYDYTSYPEGINIKEIILKFSNDKEIRFSSGESIGMYIDNDGKTGFKPSYTISQQCSFTDTPILKEVYININHKKKTGESFNKEYFSDFFQYMNEFGYGVGFIFFIKYETDETNTTSIKINPNYGIDFSWIIDTGDEYITLKYSNINESIGSANKNCKIKIQDFMTCSIP